MEEMKMIIQPNGKDNGIKSTKQIDGGELVERENEGLLDIKAHVNETNRMVGVKVAELCTPEGADKWGVYHLKIDTLVVRLAKQLEAYARAAEAQMVLGILLKFFCSRYGINPENAAHHARGFARMVNPEEYPLLVKHPLSHFREGLVRDGAINNLCVKLDEVYQDYTSEEAVIGTYILAIRQWAIADCIIKAENFLRELERSHLDKTDDRMLGVITLNRFIYTYFKDVQPRVEKVELQKSVTHQVAQLVEGVDTAAYDRGDFDKFL
jgi:hypothetical protein